MMTSRTYTHYTDTQILSLRACITLDDLISRNIDRNDMTFRELENAVNLHPKSIILEWPNGELVCFVHDMAITANDLLPGEIVGAYRNRENDRKLLYFLE